MPKFNSQNDAIKGSMKGPAYAQLALIIKNRIASGEYPQGSKIPSESDIARSFGLTTMTVRQAIHTLAERGLLRRVHGSGTYVCRPDWTKASFNMEWLLEILNDKDNLDIRILNAGLVKASPKAGKALHVPEGELIIRVLRLVSHHKLPILLNKAHLIYDPHSPIVESELEASSLSGLFTGEGNSYIKKALLKLEPCNLKQEEANFLKASILEPVFKIRYTFFGYQDSPVGSGWFMIPASLTSFSTKIGVWDDED